MLNRMSDSVDSPLPVSTHSFRFLICKTSQVDGDLQVAFYR